MFCGEKLQTKMQKCWVQCIFFYQYLLMEVPKSVTRKKSKEDEQTSAELSSAHRHLQTKCQFVQTSYIKWIKLFLFAIYMYM